MAKSPMVPVNLRLPLAVLAAIDRAGDLAGEDRSTWIRRAIEGRLTGGTMDVWSKKVAALERRVGRLEKAQNADPTKS
jgi:hypothetical protein